MKTRAWLSFWILGLIWGSSFMLIRIGVGEFRPIEVVFIRTAIAAVGLSIVIYFRHIRIPVDWPTIRALFITGLGNVVAPYMLITWGEQTVPSGMAAVFQATAALFTLVVAHFFFTDERMTPQRVAGLILGFTGVIVLFSGELMNENPLASGLAGQLAIVVASMFYAVFAVYSRKLIQAKVEPIIIAAGTMITGAVITAPFVFLTEGGLTPLVSISEGALFAVVLLGLLNTFIAYLFFYYVIQELGASRASMVTYIVPPVGIALGALLLNEHVGVTLILGAALIFSGIGIVNLRLPHLMPKKQSTGV